MVRSLQGVPFHISIHAPREGSDAMCTAFWHGSWRYFYPRSPRGERRFITLPDALKVNFYPRSPRGERRHGLGLTALYLLGFLSTLPARGATPPPLEYPPPMPEFLSTLPARGATYIQCRLGRLVAISIHAPREGSDCNPYNPSHAQRISIHAPREGSDSGR